MKLKSSIIKLTLALTLLGLVSRTVAAEHTWLDCESSYLGDGWFRYRVGAQTSPFVQSFESTFFGVDFTNLIETQVTPGWLFTNDAGAQWKVDSSNPPSQATPFYTIFGVRSSYTNYHQGMGVLLLSLILYEDLGDVSGVVSENVVGYWTFPALVPGLPEEEDGSPPTLYTNITYSDVTITDLLHKGDVIHGIEFNSPDTSTYRLEISKNMSDWSKVAYIYAQSGSNTWVRPSGNLGVWGNFFRLAYIGWGEVPTNNLPPLDHTTSPTMMTRTASKKSLSLSASADRGRIKVHFNTTPGQKYEIDVLSAGKMVWSTKRVASDNELTVTIPTGNIPPQGIIKAEEIP